MTQKMPKIMDIPAAWTGEEIANPPEKWRWKLKSAEIKELAQAAETFPGNHKTKPYLTAADFPLHSLMPKVQLLRETLIRGIGFEVIRGMPVEDLDQEIIKIIFRGIGLHIGNARPQNAAGDLLGHVHDLGADSKDPNTRIYQTSERQTFHTDSADVVGLLCLTEAREGGESMLVSAVSIYNEIRKTRSDLLPFLFEKIATDRRGEIPTGANPYFEIPVFSWHKGFLTVMYQRQYIESAQRFPDALRLTEKHIEALDLFDSLANDPRFHLKMRLRPGDMQFVYNHSLLHDRTAFVDYPEHEKRRHLLRLWLSVPGDRELPDCFAERYGTVEPGIRGGVVI